MESWLRCRVSPGQFSIEYAVEGEAFDGTGFSLFAPVETVELDREPLAGEVLDGNLLIQIIGSEGELRLVRLPRQAIGSNEFVTVKADQLECRPSAEKV